MQEKENLPNKRAVNIEMNKAKRRARQSNTVEYSPCISKDAGADPV